MINMHKALSLILSIPERKKVREVENVLIEEYILTKKVVNNL